MIFVGYDEPRRTGEGLKLLPGALEVVAPAPSLGDITIRKAAIREMSLRE